MKQALFYHKRPVFGLDLGSQSIKAMQLELHSGTGKVVGYGSIATNPKFIQDGAITDIPKTAELIDTLLAEEFVGKLSTNRVVMGIPVAHVFTRVITLPQMSQKELASAIEIEIEQSIPVPTRNLYYDYQTTLTNDPENMLVRMVAAPRKIVDSYVSLCQLLNLDLSLIQTNMEADAQLCMLYENIQDDSPYIITDFGGKTADIGLIHKTLQVTGTVEVGGLTFTQAIAKALGATEEKAQAIKVSKGLNAGHHQAQIKEAITPQLDKVVQEIKRIQKFYKDRLQQGDDIVQIVITGGGANMPGLGDYLTNATRIPTRVSSPWTSKLTFGGLQPPADEDLPRYLTAAGLALSQDSEVGV